MLAKNVLSKILYRLYPYFIEGSRTGSIMAIGDVLAQTTIEDKNLKDIEGMRTLKYGSLGFLFVGPLVKYWYTFLDRCIAKNQAQYQRAFKKMLLDQSIVAPTVYLSITTLVGLINGESCSNIQHRVRVQYPHIMKNNYMVWPAVLMINFSIIPLKYQVIFSQSAAVIWNIFLSSSLNGSTETA